MVRRILMALALLSLIGAGCAKSAEAATRTVLVDNKATGYVGSFLAYYPNTLRVHAGDTVDFKEMWSGEPHSVTMGKLVEAGLAAAKGANPNAAPPPAFAKLPSMFPNGPGDLNQNAAQPCFITSGDPSRYKGETPCPKASQPAFDGKQDYYNSGFLKEGSTFTVKLADDIAPGTYHYYCNVHGPMMSGSFTVVGTDAKTPTDTQVNAAGAKQFKAVSDKLAAAASAARTGKTIVPGNIAGYGDPSVQSGAVDEFFPASINAKVGEKVTWTLIGFHTISFGTPPGLGTFKYAPDGSVHLDPKAVAPAGGPPAQVGTGDTKLKTTDAGTYDGTGFKSSGASDSFPPNLAAYAVTFTKAGTYPFRCIIHPGMGGVVTVR